MNLLEMIPYLLSMTPPVLCDDVLLRIADTVGGCDLETLLSLSLSSRMLQQACRPWKYQTVHVNHLHPCFEVAGFCRSNRSVIQKAVTLSFRDVVFEYGGLHMLLDILGSVVVLKFQSVSIDGEDGAPVLDDRIRTVCMDNCDFSRRALHLIFGSSCIEGWSLSRFADLHQIVVSDSHTSPLPLPRLRGAELRFMRL